MVRLMREQGRRTFPFFLFLVISPPTVKRPNAPPKRGRNEEGLGLRCEGFARTPDSFCEAQAKRFLLSCNLLFFFLLSFVFCLLSFPFFCLFRVRGAKRRGASLPIIPLILPPKYPPRFRHTLAGCGGLDGGFLGGYWGGMGGRKGEG